MSKIAELLDPTVAQQMQAVAKSTAVVAKVKKGEPAFVVHKAATDPNPPKRHAEVCKCKTCESGETVAMTSEAFQATYYPHHLNPAKAPRKLTEADTIQAKYDIDPESHALMEVECVDCERPVHIDPTDPTVRAACCVNCTRIRVAYAIQDQRRVEIIRRDTRTTTQKEQDMDLNNIPDAEAGAILKESLRAEKAKKIKAAKPVVEAERRKADKKAKKATKAKQRERKQLLPAFKVGTTLEVPALDLSSVPSLDESPSAVERSPYNKARFRLANDKALDPEETTYRTLMVEHERLRALEAERVASKKAEEPKKAKKVAIVAKVDDDAVARLAKVLDVSPKKAKKILAAMS